ncbi:hypothetical protein MSP8886_02283 [Marinomonas spartinae]|uniref:DUF6795 domain-containing protein n=1 Tax=Marinomonas spartinae TaxID=1792290 RepID=A0A1A8TF29_9GAMM|nr:DUF6795 domain-containing protein [Marinomonas spartinae]SBS31927.1 hypothetical protein MSP8886_02283 [Marinomonas spartinae]
MFGLFKTYDVHMCSEVKGVLTLDGSPLGGIVVNRYLKFAYKLEKEDQTITNQDGSFYLPEVKIQSKIPGDMFSQESTFQLITVNYSDKSYELWRSKFPGLVELSEYKKKLSCLNGDLSSEKVNFAFQNDTDENLEFSASSICRWENDFEVYQINDDTDYFKDL